MVSRRRSLGPFGNVADLPPRMLITAMGVVGVVTGSTKIVRHLTGLVAGGISFEDVAAGVRRRTSSALQRHFSRLALAARRVPAPASRSIETSSVNMISVIPPSLRAHNVTTARRMRLSRTQRLFSVDASRPVGVRRTWRCLAWSPRAGCGWRSAPSPLRLPVSQRLCRFT